MSSKNPAIVEAKKAAVADIVSKLNDAKSVVVVSYSGLTVAQVTELRKQCREQDTHYCVLKNRLVKLALEEKGITGLDDALNGPNAFVFGMKDEVTAPKIISDFIEKNKLTSLQVTAGIMNGKAADATTMNKLAKMPSREQLLAKLVGSMSNSYGSFVRVVEAYRKQKAGEE